MGASVGGIDQSALASNKFVEADSVLGQGVYLQMVEGWSCELNEFPQPGVFLVSKELHQAFL